MIVYVLRLSGDYWYVGRVADGDLDARVAQHIRGDGAEWTKLHAVEGLDAERTIADARPTDEDARVIELMAAYGIDRVRGGTFCTPVLDEAEKRILGKMVDSAGGTCYQCHQPGHCANECAVTLQMAAKRGGDWECPRCGNDVFASKDACGKCNERKPAAAKKVAAVAGWKPGDWKCPACGDHVFAKNAACRKCFTAKPASPKRPLAEAEEKEEPAKKPKTDAAAPALKPGDWACAGCQAHNFASRKACFKCHKAKPRAGAEPVTDCVVCLSSPVRVLVTPCNHLCVCETCAPALTTCPMCRGPAAGKETVYQ